MRPLRKGLRLPDFKSRSLSNPKIYLPPPARFITIPLDQHAGALVRPLVQTGDPVFVGTKIAEGFDWASVPIHSSVSGHVSHLTPDSILIESDEADHLDISIQVRSNIPSDPRELTSIIREAGVVDLGGSGATIHPRLHAAQEKGIELLIVNGCESEPFLTTHHILILNHSL